MSLPTGFLQIHSNQQEQLCQVIVNWIKTYPLAPLEKETILVQSNGVAQWLQLALARDDDLGVSAQLDLFLPGRFLWQAYRAVLGDDLPRATAFDKSALIWCIYRLLPHCTAEVYQPIIQYLQNDEQHTKRYQLAWQLADLYDQYQIYRGDWLFAWQDNQPIYSKEGKQATLADEQLWQAQLWRDICAAMPEAQKKLNRAQVHQAFLAQAKNLTAENRPQALPRRIIVFAISSLPLQTIEVLQAIANCSQIFLTVHNPCQYFWGDLRAQKQQQKMRHRLKQSLHNDDAQHPLLSAWGRQGKDYIRLLNECDQSEQFEHLLQQQKIDLFAEHAANSLLQQWQNTFLNLYSLEEAKQSVQTLKRDDTSFAFHVCHSPQREVEVLHDQLLRAFLQDADLQPQDILVMAPDINEYAPHIQAVFGRLDEKDTRYIPFVLSDQNQGQNNPLLQAITYLLQLPEQRCTAREILDLLAVPAIRRKFALHEQDLPLIQQWIENSGIRWGLDLSHRQGLHLGDFAQNTWLFGIERILLGYCKNDELAWQGIQPYNDVAGLDAVLAGKFIAFIQLLNKGFQQLQTSFTWDEWRAVLMPFFEQLIECESAAEFQLFNQLNKAFEQIGAQAELIAFNETLPIKIVAKHVLDVLQQSHLNQRFFAGGVNFASLMPMRAIPFKWICILGMSDGNYPRQQTYNDFDLMRFDYRAGDRARREDEHYLFLEALLSAREKVYISYVGRSIYDNEPRPASVLVNQLRDYLRLVWGEQALQQREFEHPLQAFSALYFTEQGRAQGYFSYAKEWQNLHQQQRLTASQITQQAPLSAIEVNTPLTWAKLRQFVQAPAAFFFKQRLKVFLEQEDQQELETERFVLDGLSRWKMRDQLISTMQQKIDQEQSVAQLDDFLQTQSTQFLRAGELAVAGFGENQRQNLQEGLSLLGQSYYQAVQQWQRQAPLQLYFADEKSTVLMNGLIDERVDGLYKQKNGQYCVVSLHTSELIKSDYSHYKHYIVPYIKLLLLTVQEKTASALLLSVNHQITLAAMEKTAAQAQLLRLSQLVEWAYQQPLPAHLLSTMAKIDEKAAWFDMARDSQALYFYRAFSAADAVDNHPLCNECEIFYRHFKAHIDQAIQEAN